MPKIFSALVISLIGWLIGTVVGKAIKTISRRYNVDKRIFRKEHPPIKFSDILAMVAMWSIFLIFIQSAVEVLGIISLTTVLGAILSFLGGALEGIAIIVVGYVLANYVSEAIKKSKIIYSDIMAGFIFFIIVYVSVALALPLVGINPTLVNNILLILIGSVGVGMAIAIGFGMKDTVAQLSKKYAKKYLK